MITLDDCIKLKITESEICEIIRLIFAKDFNKRDNLRDRHSNALKKGFKTCGIEFVKSDYMSDDSGNIDIDLLFQTKTKAISLEVKTSLVPDYLEKVAQDNIDKRIQSVINGCDIKLIKRNNESFTDLKGDIHLQIYFADYTKKKDKFLESKIILALNKEFQTIDDSVDYLAKEISKAIYAEFYIERTFFVGWIDKETLIKQLEHKQHNQQTWTFPNSKRFFWTCKSKDEARKPIDKIEKLKRRV